MTRDTLKRNQSVIRVLDIIDILARNRQPMKLQDIADRLEMSPSTVYRFLVTLIEAGYIKQNEETLKYYLTLKICEIANLVQESLNIRELAVPILKELAEKCQESACMAVEEDFMAVYVEKVEGPEKMIRGFQRIGKRAPLYCTGVGKLFLTQMEADRIQAVVDQGFHAFTKNTITDKAALLQELDRIKQLGYALDNEECEEGARCVAAPVRDYSGKIIAAISISGPVSRLSEETIARKKTFVLQASRKLSEILGYAGHT